MAFVNERITPEDREKYFSNNEILNMYYPIDRDWTIDRARESFLFLHGQEREDMYLDELEDKYGEYRRQWDIFVFQNRIMDVETIRPLRFVHQFNIDKFIAREINVLNNMEYDEAIFKEIFTEAMAVNRGFGIYMNPDDINRFKFEIDFSEMKLRQR